MNGPHDDGKRVRVAKMLGIDGSWAEIRHNSREQISAWDLARNWCPGDHPVCVNHGVGWGYEQRVRQHVGWQIRIGSGVCDRQVCEARDGLVGLHWQHRRQVDLVDYDLKSVSGTEGRGAIISHDGNKRVGARTLN